MNEEEAKGTLKTMKENIDKKYLKSRNSVAIESALNLLEKKDKIIDLIVKELYKKAHISTKCYLQKSIEECMKLKNCYECIKQYFERKVENGN